MTTNQHKFYVYSYHRSDGTPYYIGKGSGKRAWKNRKPVNRPKNSELIVILESNLTEAHAYDIERDLVLLLGRIDLGTGTLRNLCDGGGVPINFSIETKNKLSKAGGHNKGKKHSRETINKMIAKNVGRKHTTETKVKIGLSHKGRPHSKETKEKISSKCIMTSTKRVSVVTPTGRYRSLTDAAKHNNTSPSRAARLSKKSGSGWYRVAEGVGFEPTTDLRPC